MTHFSFTDRNNRHVTVNVATADIITAVEETDGAWMLTFRYGRDDTYSHRFESYHHLRSALQKQLGLAYLKIIGA